MNQQLCQEHNGKQLISICIAKHECNKKVCPVCIHQHHMLIGNQYIIPSEQYQEQILKALKLKEQHINNICGEEKKWVALTKNIQSQCQNLINQINNYWQSVYKTFQTKAKMLEKTRKELETRSILEFQKNDIQIFSELITIQESQIKQLVDEELQYSISKQNREQIENKLINLVNEIKQSLIIQQQPKQQNQEQNKSPSPNIQLNRTECRNNFRTQLSDTKIRPSLSVTVQGKQSFKQQLQNIIQPQVPVQQNPKRIKIQEITQEQAQLILQQNKD